VFEIELRRRYGTLTNPFNEDGSTVVARGASAVCGMPTAAAAALPTRTVVEGCQVLRPQGVTPWRSCLEGTVHAYVHSQVGGAWDCPFDLTTSANSATDTLAESRAGFLALNAVNVWKVALSSGLLACPSTCAPGDLFGECRCECWDAAGDAERAGLSATEVYGLLSESRILEFLLQPMGSKKYLTTEGGDGKISFKGLSKTDNNAALRLLLDLACSPGKLGAMATDGAANDPFFWALHVEYDRMWHAGRLAGDLGIDGWEEDSDACPGANPADTLPFAAFSSDGKTLPTNTELYAYFSPSNDDLPYLYDNFRAFEPEGLKEVPGQDDDAQDLFDDGDDDMA
jgi:hypothetical protein